MAPFISRRGADLRYSSYDVLVVGGGIAGLTAALGAAHRWNVGLITKGTLDQTTTFLAQGGIAAAMSPHDSPALHLQDTLKAGVGLCDAEAVRVLVEEGPARVSSSSAKRGPIRGPGWFTRAGTLPGAWWQALLPELSLLVAGSSSTRTSSSSICSWMGGVAWARCRWVKGGNSR